jgi:hypothetical protein
MWIKTMEGKLVNLDWVSKIEIHRVQTGFNKYAYTIVGIVYTSEFHRAIEFACYDKESKAREYVQLLEDNLNMVI